MKYLLFPIILSIFCHLSANCQENQNYVADFDTVFSVYSKRIEPYLKKFAENNYRNLDEILSEATYSKYKAKFRGLRTEYLAAFEKSKNNVTYSNVYFHGFLDGAIQFEFPCLDYTY